VQREDRDRKAPIPTSVATGIAGPVSTVSNEVVASIAEFEAELARVSRLWAGRAASMSGSTRSNWRAHTHDATRRPFADTEFDRLSTRFGRSRAAVGGPSVADP
jgi:hypothetical protein